MEYSYRPSGVCSREIHFEIKNGRVHNVRFTGGCSGNTQGVGKLVEGMIVDEVIDKLQGISCAGKGTSCPDQLAKALKSVEEK